MIRDSALMNYFRRMIVTLALLVAPTEAGVGGEVRREMSPATPVPFLFPVNWNLMTSAAVQLMTKLEMTLEK
jgi:hypothetical protein